MEENSFSIGKKYIYTGLTILVLFFGYFMYSLGATKANVNTPMQSGNQAGMGNSNDMSSHHKPAIDKSSRFYESAVGKNAPEFELQDINGNIVKLSDYKGKNIVLFFNEGAMCYPSCWNQVAAFAKDERFNNEGTVALSIVVDSQAQWQKIFQKVPQMAGTNMLFDISKKTSIDYDVLFTQSSMHKGSYPGHTYFIIGKDGVIRYTFDDSRMAINNEQIASELEKINGA
ncbi:redoxin domain-containing protein [Candidatus Woesearchaeota archaeon]|nr:redoxin domain-containing protein [Candidatus Woesearchaeota archaeon]